MRPPTVDPAQLTIEEQVAMEVAHARRTDPATSHEAARAVTPTLRASQAAVLAVFTAYRGHRMTHRDLITRYARERMAKLIPGLPPQSDSGLRTRCRELVRQGKVVAVGTVKIGRRRHTVWEVAP